MDLSDQAHFGNYDPSSFGWPHRVPDLVPFTFKGVNFGSCARDVEGVFTALLAELEPQIPGGIAFGPKDDWAYSATDDLPDGSWSFHRYGIAFDLNWSKNPMGNYANNPVTGAGVIPYAAAASIARKYGCEYGGTWSGGANRLGFKDYMHFECHLSPQVAAGVHPAPTIPESEEIDVLIFRRKSGRAYPVLLAGSTKTVLTDHASVVALVEAGAKQITVADADWARIRKGATA